jgi:hypothetical protein
MIPSEGSRIKDENTSEGRVLSWFDYKGGASDIGGTLFLLFWLVAWAAGEIFAIYGLFFGSVDLGAKIFLTVWLLMWTFGGIAAFVTLLNSLRPSKPTRLSFLYDGKLRFEQGTYQKRYIDTDGEEASTVVKRGKKYGVFERSQINNVMLERIGERKRLSFDYRSQRIEVGKGLTEPEREWLFEALKKYTRS